MDMNNTGENLYFTTKPHRPTIKIYVAKLPQVPGAIFDKPDPKKVATVFTIKNIIFLVISLYEIIKQTQFY